MLTQPARRTLPGSLPALVLFISMVLSAVLSNRGWEIIVLALMAAIAAGFLWLLAARVTRNDLAPLSLGLLVLVLVELSVSIFQVHVTGLQRAVGTTIHANVLGAIVAPVLFLFLPSIGPRRSPLLVPGAIVSAALLAYCASRGAILACAAGSIAMAAVLISMRATRVRHPFGLMRPSLARQIMVAGVVLGLLLVLAGGPIVRRFQVLDSVADPLGRPLLWAVALELVAHRPFLGYGPLAWPEYAPIVEPMIRPEVTSHSHSQYLELALWTGALGVGSLIWLGFAFAARLWETRGNRPGWSAAGIGALVAMATVSVFDAAGGQISVLGIWATGIGMVLTMTENQET